MSVVTQLWSLQVCSIRLASRASSFFDMCKIIALPWWFIVPRKLGMVAYPVTFSFQSGSGSQRITLWSNEHVAAVKEIFYQNEYKSKNLNPKTIVDLGANIGLASVYLSGIYPNARIWSVEPDPTTFQLLGRQIGSNPRYTLSNCAISGSSGTISFFSSMNSLSSSVKRRSFTDREVKIPSFTLDAYCKKCGIQFIDLLKFDVEGAEWDVFVKNPKVTIESFIGEYHADLVGKPVSHFIALFPKHTVYAKLLHKGRYILHGHLKKAKSGSKRI